MARWTDDKVDRIGGRSVLRYGSGTHIDATLTATAADATLRLEPADR